MTILRSMPSTSWTLFAALAGALTATACKKDSGETQPPDASAGDADAGDVSDAASSADDDAAPEILTVDTFEETMQARTGDVSDCFATAKEAKADLAGKLVYDFTIDGEGKVSDIVADPESTIKDEALNTCVRDKAKGWSFPKTRDGKPTTFPYKFNLSWGQLLPIARSPGRSILARLRARRRTRLQNVRLRHLKRTGPGSSAARLTRTT